MPSADVPVDEFDGLLDPECIYRMVALMCASFVAPRDQHHTIVMSIADGFLEYIDPLADNPAAHQEPTPRKAKK